MASKENQEQCKCGELLEKISQMVSGELDEECCEKVKAHLQKCRHCRELAQAIELVNELCGKISQENQKISAPCNLLDKFMSELRDGQRG